jgi:hypothetical protein
MRRLRLLFVPTLLFPGLEFRGLRRRCAVRPVVETSQHDAQILSLASGPPSVDTGERQAGVAKLFR